MALCLLAACRTYPERERVAPELAEFFDGRAGCFALYDIRRDRYLRYQPRRCDVRSSPCSTFKIPHALFALETGVLEDENTELEWDGTPQFLPEWERDHTLATAIRVSCVWYFQRVARAIGEDRMRSQLASIDYGNRDISGGIDRFWLTSTLSISPNEQVEFLARLYRDRLPIDRRVTATVKEMLVLEAEGDAVLSGKTGGGLHDDGSRIGWFVGHLKSGVSDYVFATRIRGSAADTSGATARGICEAILAYLRL